MCEYVLRSAADVAVDNVIFPHWTLLHRSFSFASFFFAICSSTDFVFTGKFDNVHNSPRPALELHISCDPCCRLETNCTCFPTLFFTLTLSCFALVEVAFCTQILCFYFSQIQWEHYKICYSIQCCPKHMHGHAPNKVHRIACYNEWNVVVFIHILFLHIFFYSWWAYAFGCCLASL